MATEDITLRVRVDQIEQAISSLPGITKAQMGRVAKAAAEAWENTEKYSKKAAKAQEKAQAEAAKAAEKSFNDIKKGATVAFGGIVGDVEDVGGALAALGPYGAAAVVGIAAVTAAVAAIPAAAGLAVYGVVSLTRAAEDAVRALEDVGGAVVVSPEQIRAVENANAAFDQVNAIVGELAIALVADMAPTLIDLSIQFVDLAASALETANAFFDGKDAIETFAIGVVSGALQAVEKFLFLDNVIVNTLKAIGTFAAALGKPIPYISGLEENLTAMNVQLAKSITGMDGLDNGTKEYSGRAAELRAKIEAAATAERDKQAASDALKASEKAAAEAEKERNKTLREQEQILHAAADAQKALSSIIFEATGATLSDEQKIIAAYGARIDRINEIVAKAQAQGVAGAELAAIEESAEAARVAALDERMAKEEELRDKYVENMEIIVESGTTAAKLVDESWAEYWDRESQDLDEWIENYEKTFGRVVDAIGDIGRAYEDLHRDRLSGIMDERAALLEAIKSQTGAERAASVEKLKGLTAEANAERKKVAAGFRIAQAAAIAQAIVDAAKSAVALIPAFAFLGPGAPFAAAGVAAAGLAVQLATIKAQKLKFHAGYDPSEYPATLAKGEGVANVRAMSMPGFSEQLRAANAGMPAGASSVVIALNDRTLQVLSARTAQIQAGARIGVGTATHYRGR